MKFWIGFARSSVHFFKVMPFEPLRLAPNCFLTICEKNIKVYLIISCQSSPFWHVEFEIKIDRLDTFLRWFYLRLIHTFP